ncbi:MAG: hypothetical protein R2754_01150 [Microthrixaceae bacterium]
MSESRHDRERVSDHLGLFRARLRRGLRASTIAAAAVVVMGAAPGVATKGDDGGHGSGQHPPVADRDGDGIDDPTECQGAVELLVNGSFETPSLGGAVGYQLVSPSQVTGWSTSDSAVEIWANGFLGHPPVDGTQIIELNATGPSVMTQSVAVSPGDVLAWSVSHRARSAGDRASLSLGTGSAAFVDQPLAGSTGGWTRYGGLLDVPAGLGALRVELAANPQTNPGGSGNLVDAVSLLRCPDTDSDGTADLADLDSDDDGISDAIEGVGDPDGDQVPNYRDLDSDGDGIPDSEEGADSTADLDGDGIPDYLDTDTDGDGIPDAVEGNGDFDGDGIPDYRDMNTDHDRIPDIYEGTADTDGDGTPDRLDPDSDDDVIPDGVEGFQDTDGDGVPNFQDGDSDGDGYPDAVDGPRFLIVDDAGVPLSEDEFVR